jgi:ATPase subunit of ABC transporter with duplicated ATPase domains
VVLVSHDRALLAETVSEIVELDRDSGQATQYRGGWDAFQHEREAARERARTEREHALARRDQLIAAERETPRRSAASVKDARGGVHDNDKQSREWVKMRAEGMAARARKIGSRAGRIDAPDAPWERPALNLRLTPAERRRTWIVALEEPSCSAASGRSDRLTSR